MPFLSLSRRARALRATTVSFVAFLVALLAGTVAVAAGSGMSARAETTTASAPVVHDGLAAEQAWATAREARLAAVRQAEAAASRAATTTSPVPRPRRATTTTSPTAATTTTTTTTTAAPAAPRVQAAAAGAVVWPAAGALTGWFGERRGGSRHTGIDIDGNTGDPVVAAAAGTVAWAGGAPAGYSGYGVVVIVDHGGGLQSVYAHLSTTKAPVGQAVAPGDRIGSVGSTGHSTGSHLHFELRRDGVPVNPLGWLPPR